jgi:hypothetical protein
MHTPPPGHWTPPYAASPPTSHSNEVEHRLTSVETTSEAHEERISFLERALKAVIYVLGALSASKTGEAAELLLSIVKKT